ncbi:MAG: alpha/beta hydrolase [Nevskia sp.]
MNADDDGIRYAELDHRGRPLRLEYRWLSAERSAAPLLVFLHEGLGSIALWRDYPRRLCAAGGFRGLVFSRGGYGGSTPRAPDEHWGPDFLEIQALDVLPKFFAAVGVHDRPWLFGHSDGGSIALIHAARHSAALAGVVVLAPHIFVEELSVSSIALARASYLDAGDGAASALRTRLARFHDDVDSAFWGWNDIWLDPRFRDWSIEALLPRIACPLLAVQGVDDEYGTMAQIDGIAARVPQCALLKLEACGHSPQRDQPGRLTAAVVEFIARHAPGAD